MSRDQVQPEGFANDGERLAFERFRDELSPLGWTIAHNLYVSRRDERGARARELDLLLLHPRHGIVLVEVKGGTIERDANGTWRQNGKPMAWAPDQQAGSATFEFREALRDNPRWAALGLQVTTGWLLCLPQADASSIALSRLDASISLAADQIVDRMCLNRPDGVADQVGRFVARTQARTAAGAAADFDWVPVALEILSPAFGFSTSLVGDLEVDQARLEADERIHRDWVENLGAFPRLHFEAGAGAGKSVVARLRALSLAESGRTVLLVCSTASLAKTFQRDVQSKSGGRVLANTLHQVLVLLARETGRPDAFGVPASGTLTLDALNGLPGQAGAIAAASSRRFDALVVDEAQDIGGDVVAALQGFLRDPAGSVWTFADAYQRFGPPRPGASDDGAASVEVPAADGADVIVMRQNHRNPEPIFRLAEGLRADGIRRFSRKRGTASRRVEYRECASPEQQRPVLDEVIRELEEQRIEPGRIAIVTLGRTDDNPLFTNRRFGRFLELDNPQLDARGARLPVPAESLPPPDPTKLYFDSVRRIKGLERGVVVLVDVPDAGPPGSMERRLLYAGVTRATTYLAVIATAERIAALQAVARSYSP